MSWTPTDEQVEKAAEALDPRAFDLSVMVFPIFGQTPQEARAADQESARRRARAVLVAVGPTIAAQALRDAGMAVETIDPAWDSALWTEGKYVPVPEWLNNRADTIEKEAGRG